MSKQDNTKKEPLSKNHVRRVVCVEIVTSKTNALKFVPSSFLREVSALLERSDEIELRVKIDSSIKEIHKLRRRSI